MNYHGFPYVRSKSKRGVRIFYHCLECGDYINSVSLQTIQCECGNVAIYADYYRFAIWDEQKVLVAKEIP